MLSQTPPFHVDISLYQNWTPPFRILAKSLPNPNFSDESLVWCYYIIWVENSFSLCYTRILKLSCSFQYSSTKTTCYSESQQYADVTIDTAGQKYWLRSWLGSHGSWTSHIQVCCWTEFCENTVFIAIITISSKLCSLEVQWGSSLIDSMLLQEET